ncbi:hypothetical protein MMC18_000903 [Xylographa bjoerkii]|nr:hypothetical protein [Xylographa bjoerkii]
MPTAISRIADSIAVYPIVILIVALWVICVARPYLNRRKTIRERGCQYPRSLPQKDPIFGLDVAFRMFRSYDGGQRSRTFQKQHEEFGPTFQSVALGKTRIFTIDPDNLRAIFSTDFKDWGVQPLRLPSWGAFLGDGVMNTDGARWIHSRALVQPMFRKDQTADLPSFDVHVARLIDLIPKDRSTVDLQPLFARLILDFTTEFIFGESVESLTPSPDTSAMEFLEAFHYGQSSIGKKTQLPMLTVFTPDKKLQQSSKIVRQFVDRYIDRALVRCSSSPPLSKARKYVLAEELVQQTKDRADVRSQLLNVFLAAHDTTAVLLTNVFFNLARHPTVYRKLRQELQHVDLDPTDFDALRNLPYLCNVITETSRFTPVVGQSARIALHDTVLPSGGGLAGTAPVFVRQNTSVQFNFFALHRRPTVYGADADKFRPERWADSKLEVGSWDYLPFSRGPRVCPAQQMALTQIRWTVARLLRVFAAVENRDPVWEFVERYRITTDSSNGCLVGLVPA